MKTMPSRVREILIAIKVARGVWAASLRATWRTAMLVARLESLRSHRTFALHSLRRSRASAASERSRAGTARRVAAPTAFALGGAWLMYFVDPAEGRRRRQLARERTRRLLRHGASGAGGGDRSGGAIAAAAQPGQGLPSAARQQATAEMPEGAGGTPITAWGEHDPPGGPENGQSSR